MMTNAKIFSPLPGELISINEMVFNFTSISVNSSFLYTEVGRKAKIYRIKNESGQNFALKVFFSSFRDRNLIEICKLLGKYSGIPGMELANRFIVTSTNSPDLVKMYPELEFAILMPWIEKDAWTNNFARKNLLNKSKLILAALSLANLLAQLEKWELAHTDISGSNVLIARQDSTVTLVGLENFFGEEFPKPNFVSTGSEGYSHPSLSASGQWCKAGDRFAGAILLSEILVWTNKEIIKASAGEHYFEQNEIGEDTKRLKLLISALEELNPIFRNLFLQAWHSRELESCPKISSWADAISHLVIS